MRDLAEFLLARIAEEETAWRGGLGLASRPEFSKLAKHMLAECESKRRLLDLHEVVTEDYAGQWWTDPSPPGTYVVTGCDHCRSAGVDGEEYVEGGPCPTLRLLALPYAEHPDYRSEWAP